jgi:hypothetical protein
VIRASDGGYAKRRATHRGKVRAILGVVRSFFARHDSHSYAIILAFLFMAMAMARDANPLKSELITLSVNVQTVWYLDRLVETGLYGNNRTEAARVALYDHCKLLIADRKLEMAPRLPSMEVTETR